MKIRSISWGSLIRYVSKLAVSEGLKNCWLKTSIFGELVPENLFSMRYELETIRNSNRYLTANAAACLLYFGSDLSCICVYKTTLRCGYFDTLLNFWIQVWDFVFLKRHWLDNDKKSKFVNCKTTKMKSHIESVFFGAGPWDAAGATGNKTWSNEWNRTSFVALIQILQVTATHETRADAAQRSKAFCYAPRLRSILRCHILQEKQTPHKSLECVSASLLPRYWQPLACECSVITVCALRSLGEVIQKFRFAVMWLDFARHLLTDKSRIRQLISKNEMPIPPQSTSHVVPLDADDPSLGYLTPWLFFRVILWPKLAQN